MLTTVEKRSQGQLFYKWTFPGAPIRIEIALNVVARLEGAIGVRNKGRTAEIGGILIGEFRSPSTVAVNDYALVEPEPGCEHRYVADALELERLCAGRDSSIPAGHIVGYFRTQREPALELRDEDIETASKHFKDSRQVILLISDSGEESTAGFLFWDGGAITPFSFLEFPFSVELLGSEAASETVAALPEPPTVHVNSELTVKGAKSYRRWLPQHMPFWLLLVLALALALGLFKLPRGRPSLASDTARPSAMAAAAPRAVPARLELQVEADGKGLNVRWNPHSDAIAQAVEGKLTILDKENSRAIGLNAQQLSSGHVFYQPAGDRIEFQLVVIGHEGQAMEESVLALLSKTEENVPASTGLPVASSKADQNKETTRSIRPAPKVFTIPLARQSATKAEPIIIKDAQLEASAQVNLAPITIPAVNLGLVEAKVAPPPVAERPRTVDPTANRGVPESKPTIAPPEVFHDAVVKTKVSPVLQQGMASFFPPGGRVEVVVRVHIDERGGVTGAEVVSKGAKFEINRRLEPAAIDAAKQWRFQPARLNDKPVLADYYITFVFQLPVR